MDSFIAQTIFENFYYVYERQKLHKPIPLRNNDSNVLT